jgi:hypothetical protein
MKVKAHAQHSPRGSPRAHIHSPEAEDPTPEVFYHLTTSTVPELSHSFALQGVRIADIGVISGNYYYEYRTGDFDCK